VRGRDQVAHCQDRRPPSNELWSRENVSSETSSKCGEAPAKLELSLLLLSVWF
jgi:hypothetical protein